MIVELEDKWHPKGYRIDIDVPEGGELYALETDSVEFDRGIEPTIRIEGYFMRVGEAPDGVPIFKWFGLDVPHVPHG